LVLSYEIFIIESFYSTSPHWSHSPLHGEGEKRGEVRQDFTFKRPQFIIYGFFEGIQQENAEKEFPTDEGIPNRLKN